MADKATSLLSSVGRQSLGHRQISARKRLIVAAISGCFASAPAWCNPAAPKVVNGNANFIQTGKLLSVTNSNGAIINWNTFSIGASETTRFNQVSAGSSVLNRVIANDPSVLLGTLSSNGRVWLVNPAGIMVGQGARIDVAGFIASTLNVRNEDFLAGRLNFGATPNAGKIENHGQIATPSGGSIYLIAPAIENHGVINAPNGEVLLAAGQTAQLVDTGTPGVKVDITGAEGNVTNLGQIISEAGRIGMAGVLVKNSGTLNASSLVKEGGRIFLKAAKAIELVDTSMISADGTAGGRIIAKTEINGQLSGELNVHGTLSTQASGPMGNGGFIETSAAHLKIASDTKITTAASMGLAGTWLIDPYDFTIAATGGDITGGALTTALGLAAVVIQTNISSATCTGATCGAGNAAGNGDIFVNDAVSWAANKLTLSAYRNININANLNGSGTASLALEYGQSAIAAGNTSGYKLASGIQVNLPAGAAASNIFSTKLGNDVSPTSYTVITALGVAADATTSPGTMTLQRMAATANLAGKYVLGSSIDACATSGCGTPANAWNAGAGFVPIGSSTAFTGTFDGLGHTITNLSINRPTETTEVGLFGWANTGSAIRNVGLVGGSVSGNNYVGALVGRNYGGAISNSYATGDVNGTLKVGGLVGRNDGAGSISNSYATGSVSGIGNSGWVGGLVGNNIGSSTISNSYATGSVSGKSWIGGLVGYSNSGPISNSYATGSVSGGGYYAGGLVGENYSTVTNSYATGSVSGNSDSGIYVCNSGNTNCSVGGLVGYNGASISNSYATGSVSSAATYSSVGGLVGYNFAGTISNSYWDILTSGQPALGIIGGGTTSGVTGRTTDNMMKQASYTPQGTAAGEWDLTNTWSIIEGVSYPYLKWQFSGTPQVISGLASGLGGGKTIQAIANGVNFAKTATGANGFYYFALPGNSVPNGNTVVTYVAGDTYKGAAAFGSTGSHATGMAISPNTFKVAGGTVSNTSLGTAKGSLTWPDIPYSVSGSNLAVSSGFSFETLSGATYTLDGNVTTVDTSQTWGGPVTMTGNATLSTGTGAIAINGAISGATYNLELSGQDVTIGAAITTSGSVLVSSSGRVTLGSSGSVRAGSAPTLVGTSFTNSSLVIDPLGSSWSVYSGNPESDNIGNLAGASAGAYSFRQYGASYGSTTPAASGNGLFYSDIPPLLTTTFTSGSADRTYDGTKVANTSGFGTTFTGLYAGDTVATLTGSYADKHVGTGKAITVTIATTDANGKNVYGYELDPSIGASGTISKASLTIAAVSDSKQYDGTAGSGRTPVVTGVFSGDSVTASQSFDGPNAGGHVLSVGSYSVNDGNGGGNYTVSSLITAGGSITPVILNIGGLAVPSKVYDGTNNADMIFQPISMSVPGITLVAHATFADKNVGWSKAVTYSFEVVGGAGNYSVNVLNPPAYPLVANITARPLSSWTGAAGTAFWSNPANWDLLPDLSNVSAAIVPAGKSVVYDAAAGTTSLDRLTAGGLNITGGTLNILSSLTVNSSFSQTGGTLAFGTSAVASITQASGNLVMPAATLASLNLAAPIGAITQSGAIIAAALKTQSLTGTTLTDVGNRIASFTAANSGSGNVSLTNAGALTLGAVSNTGGNIAIDNTGAVTTVGAISAPAGAVSIFAHSPLSIGAAGVSAGGSITLTAGETAATTDQLALDGAVESTGSAGSITLLAGDNLVQNANVTTHGGAVNATAQLGNISMALGTTSSSGGGSIGYKASAGDLTLASLDAGSGAIDLGAARSINTVTGFTGANLIGGKALIVAGGSASLSTLVKQLDVTVSGAYSIADLLTGAVMTDVSAAVPLPTTSLRATDQASGTGTGTTQQQPAQTATIASNPLSTTESVLPAQTTLLVLDQVLTTVASTTQQTSTTTQGTTTAALPMALASAPGGSGPQLLSNATQTVGGGEGTFGASSSAGGTLTGSSSAGSGSGSASGATSGSGGDKTGGDKSSADKPSAAKPADDRSVGAKKDDAKADDDKSASAKKDDLKPDEKKDEKKDDKKKDEEGGQKKQAERPAPKKLATCS